MITRVNVYNMHYNLYFHLKYFIFTFGTVFIKFKNTDKEIGFKYVLINSQFLFH